MHTLELTVEAAALELAREPLYRFLNDRAGFSCTTLARW